ncbi:MAG: hypothetical protein ACYDDF_04980 [Thermoplasmatota archaeon]
MVRARWYLAAAAAIVLFVPGLTSSAGITGSPRPSSSSPVAASGASTSAAVVEGHTTYVEIVVPADSTGSPGGPSAPSP